LKVFILNLLFAASAAIGTFITPFGNTGKRIVKEFGTIRNQGVESGNANGNPAEIPAGLLRLKESPGIRRSTIGRFLRPSGVKLACMPLDGEFDNDGLSLAERQPEF
jgi:hypothetical protein